MRLPCSAFALAIMVAGCSGGEAPTDETAATTAPTFSATASDGADPSAQRPPLPGPDDKDPRALMVYWQAAVEAHDDAALTAIWREGTVPRPIDPSVVAASYDVGRTEGAAGSTYYTAPVTMTTAAPDGTATQSAGTLTARRVNDVPGASDEQLSWRIVSVEID